MPPTWTTDRKTVDHQSCDPPSSTNHTTPTQPHTQLGPQPAARPHLRRRRLPTSSTAPTTTNTLVITIRCEQPPWPDPALDRSCLDVAAGGRPRHYARFPKARAMSPCCLSQTRGRCIREVPGRARCPGRGGHLGRAHAAEPSPGPVLAGLPARGRPRRRPCASRPSTTRSPPASRCPPRSATPAGAGLRPAARRHLARAARQAGRRREPRRPASRHLRLGPVHAADDAGRGVPRAAGDAGEVGIGRGDVFAGRVAQVTIAASRDETLPILTGVRIEIERRHASRCWPPTATGSRCASCRGGRSRRRRAASPWCAPARSPRSPRPSARRGDVTLALTTGGATELIGFEAGGRRTTSLLVDGDYPKVRALFPEPTPTHAVVESAALIEAVKRVALVAERNTPVRLTFTDGQAHARGRPGRRRAGLGGARVRRWSARTSRSPSTRSSCSTASARSDRRYARLSFTQAQQARGDHRPGGRRRTTTGPLPD